MIPQTQRNRHNPAEGVWGDCHRAALASVLELPLDDVPHFGDGGPDGAEFNRRVAAFLAARGLLQVHALYQADRLDDVLAGVNAVNPGVYYLIGGRSRTGVDHTVVGLGDRIVHDPSITASGIVGPCEDGFFWITYLASAVCSSRPAPKDFKDGGKHALTHSPPTDSTNPGNPPLNAPSPPP